MNRNKGIQFSAAACVLVVCSWCLVVTCLLNTHIESLETHLHTLPTPSPNCKDCAKMLQGSCRSEYEPVTYQIVAADNQTPICLVGLPKKPEEWKWSRDGSILAYEIQSDNDKSSRIITLSSDGIGQQSVTFLRNYDTNYWTLSPDGQYLRHSGAVNHHWLYEVMRIATGEKICFNSTDGYSSAICPPIELTNGRWWSGDFPELILENNNPSLWNLIKYADVVPSVSPDRSWIVVSSFAARTTGERINQLPVPMIFDGSGPIPCAGHPTMVAWRPDSRQFAIFPWGDKLISVWDIRSDDSISLAYTTTLQSCPIALDWSPVDNRFVTR